MPNGLNKYLHGTVWSWSPGEDALIISSDEQNSQNPEVNCISVSSTVKSVSISIDNANYIQCNQIHTVKKEELSAFKGAVTAPILAAVKAKIKDVFNMSASRDTDHLQVVRDTAAKLIGQLAKLQQDSDMPYVAESNVIETPVMSDAAVDSHANVAIALVDLTHIEESQKGNIPVISENIDNLTASDDKPEKRTGKQQGKKAQSDAAISKRTSKPIRKMIQYTNEDEVFVLDNNSSIEDIMKRFNFTKKSQAYGAKTYLKTRRAKRQ